MPTRDELDARLDVLQDQLPALATDEDADFDLLTFQQQAEAIAGDAAPDDVGHVRARIDDMLCTAGLLPARGEAQDP